MPPTPARILDVGNCNPDHAMLRMILERHFNVTIDRVMFVAEALEHMRATQYALILFNRLIFEDGSEGLALVHQAKADPAIKTAPMMMISNYPEAQSAATAAGAVPGFGKSKLAKPETIELLSQYLPRKAAVRT